MRGSDAFEDEDGKWAGACSGRWLSGWLWASSRAMQVLSINWSVAKFIDSDFFSLRQSASLYPSPTARPTFFSRATASSNHRHVRQRGGYRNQVANMPTVQGRIL